MCMMISNGCMMKSNRYMMYEMDVYVYLESCVQVIATSAEKTPQQREKNIPNIHDE